MSRRAKGAAEVNRKTFDTCIQLPITRDSIAKILEVSADTLERWIKKTFGCTFKQIQAQNRDIFRRNIIGKQYELAMKGDRVMLIWLGKNYCDQSESPNNDDDSNEGYSRPESMKDDE